MEPLFLILLVLLIAGGYLLYKRQKEATAAAAPRQKKPSDPLADWNSSGGDQQFFEIKPGDLIKRDDGDFFVRGTIRLEEGGSVWSEHLLDDAGGTKRWLAVEDEDGLELSSWQRLPMADVESGAPGDRSVVVRGVAYKFVEKGTAAFTALGTTSTGEKGSAEYMDYEAADSSLLGFERYDGGPWEVALGEKVNASDITVYPAST